MRSKKMPRNLPSNTRSGKRYGESVGNPSKLTIPMRLRNPYIPRFMNGSQGWRGKGWAKMRLEILRRDKNRSTTTGYDEKQGMGLMVDHIMPFRLGGRNKPSNLRTVDSMSNWSTDNMRGAKERAPKRDPKW